MRVLITDQGAGVLPEGCTPRAEITMCGRTLRFGSLERPELFFRPSADYNREYVLVRVMTFALTDDDLSALGESPPDRASRGEFGTDFIGEVVAAGRDVPLSVGDHVVPVPCWPPQQTDTVSESGLPATASAELRRLHHEHLMRVPPEVNVTAAARLPTAAVQGYAMVRRAEITTGSNVLITAVTTAPGRMAVRAAKRRGAVVHALTDGLDVPSEFGVQQSFSPAEPTGLSTYAKRIRGFDAVVDPRPGQHLAGAVRLCGFGARYVFGPVLSGDDAEHALDTAALASLTVKQIALIGQHLGERADLAAALADAREESAPLPIGRSFSGDDEITDFLHQACVSDPAASGDVTYSFEKG